MRNRETRFSAVVSAFVLCFVGATAQVQAAPILSAVPTLGGAPIDFEGFAEGTLIDTQYAGITFGQDDGGRPMIDNSPFLFGYIQSSGEAVLTGSTEGGAQFPTVAGLELTADTLWSAVEFFFSDTAPLGDYTVSAFGGGGGLLEEFTIALADVASGQYVGFTRGAADIKFVTIDSNIENDAFAIDDVRFSAVPEPATLALLGLALAGFAFAGRNRRSD